MDCRVLSWITEYAPHYKRMDYHRGLAWTIIDYRGLLNMHPKPLTTPKRYGAGMAHTVVSIGFINDCRLSCTIWRIIVDYGRWWTIMDCHGLSWAIMDYRGFWTIIVLSWIGTIMALPGISLIVDSGLWWYIMYYPGLWTVMDYRGLSSMTVTIVGDRNLLWILMEYGLSWIIMDYGLSYTIMDYHASS